MPDVGYYEKKPRPESVAKLIEYLTGNEIVASVTSDGDHVLIVDRKNKVSITAYLTNVYTVSIADVNDIYWSNGSKLGAIVTMSAWNGYTRDAKSWCREKGVGLFTFKEFLGAVYFVGKRFLDYTPPKRD